MTYKIYLAFIVFIVVVYNASETLRLRWRVMQRSNCKSVPISRERLFAWLLSVIGVGGLCLWAYFALRLLMADGDVIFAVVAWVVSIGLGAFFLLRSVYQSLKAFRTLGRTRAEHSDV